MSKRKKSVSRKKSGGRQKPTNKTSGSRKTTKKPASGITFSISDAKANPLLHDPLLVSHYDNVPVFQIPGRFAGYGDNPPKIVVDGVEYTNAYIGTSTLSQAVDFAVMRARIGNDVAILEYTGTRSGTENSRYHLYRTEAITGFKIIPRVGKVAERLRHYDGGWSTPNNGMGVQLESGYEMIHLPDRLGQLRTNIQENQYVGDIGLTARLDSSHDNGASGYPQNTAYVKVEWESPRESRGTKGSVANEVAALNLFMAAEETFGSYSCFVEGYKATSPTSGWMTLMVSNTWEQGGARFKGDHRYGPLRKLGAFTHRDFDP
jgi:hypothetical protein